MSIAAAVAAPPRRRSTKKTQLEGDRALFASHELEARKRASWIQTYTGRKFYPFAPFINDIDPEDIAHALSLQCRWNGHIKAVGSFYSVAQHAVLCSYYASGAD